MKTLSGVALPKLEQSEIKKSLKIGSNIITIRPWKTKDERLFLIKKASLSKAQQEDSDKIKEVLINDLIKPCVLDVLNSSFDDLSMNALKALMLEIRKISVGDVVEGVNYKCECGFRNTCDIELTDDLYQYVDGDYSVKKINNDLSLKFKPIGAKYVKTSSEDIDYLYKSIDSIIYQEIEYKDFTKKEFEEFFDSLDINTAKKIIEFLSSSVDSFTMVGHLKCASCGKETEVDFGEMPNFFIP